MMFIVNFKRCETIYWIKHHLFEFVFLLRKLPTALHKTQTTQTGPKLSSFNSICWIFPTLLNKKQMCKLLNCSQNFFWNFYYTFIGKCNENLSMSWFSDFIGLYGEFIEIMNSWCENDRHTEWIQFFFSFYKFKFIFENFMQCCFCCFCDENICVLWFYSGNEFSF